MKKKIVRNKWYKGLVNHSVPLRSSSRDDILDYIYRTDIVNWYVTYLMRKGIENEEVKDYIQEIWVQICEKTQEKWNDLYEQGKAAITAYVASIIKQNCVSVNSKAFYRIKKPTLNEVHFSDEQWEAFDEEGTNPDFITFYEYEETYDTEN